jgi:hypothetical protein
MNPHSRGYEMKHLIFTTLFLSVLTLLIGCTANLTLAIVDDDSKSPVSNLPISIIDEDGNTIIFENVHTDLSGQLTINLNDIPGDSFLVDLGTDIYSNTKYWVNISGENKLQYIYLNKIVTSIEGYVMIEDTDTPIDNCGVSCQDFDTVAKTDSMGYFILSFPELDEYRNSLIKFSKPPDFKDNSANVTPISNSKVTLEMVIFLTPIEEYKSDTTVQGNGRPPVGPDPPLGNPKNSED